MATVGEIVAANQSNIYNNDIAVRGGGPNSLLDDRVRTPTSIVSDDPFQFSSLSYPRDVTNDLANGHYMLFYVNVQNKTKYIMEPADPLANEGRGIGEEVQSFEESYEGQVFGKTVSEFVTYADTSANYTAGLIGRGKTGNIISSDEHDLRKGRPPSTGISTVLPTTTRITDSVAIYLPPNVKDTLAAGYTDAATGIAGLAAVGGMNFFNAMKRQDFQSAAESLVGTASSFIKEAAKRLGGEILEGLTGAEGTVELVNKAFGQATNPYMEVLFDKMELRNFSYNFVFAPRNKNERDDVQKIIQLFRFHMAPELKGAQNRFLTLPSTFDIHYMYQLSAGIAKENNFYSKIATCVLTGCDVDYTPGAVKSFHDGSPTQITMNLTFKETEMITKEKVNAGY
jgi:hypothetical protein